MTYLFVFVVVRFGHRIVNAGCGCGFAIDLQFAGLSVHERGSSARLFPAVVIFNQLGNGLVGQHLTDPMERLAVELERLLEQDLVLNGPFVWKGREIGQILEGPVQIVLVPKQHAQGLFGIVAEFFLGHLDVFIHWKIQSEISWIVNLQELEFESD